MSSNNSTGSDSLITVVRVDENEARAWGSEFFKRLYHEGMNARFHAVTWSSDSGSSASYEANVNNAFRMIHFGEVVQIQQVMTESDKLGLERVEKG